MSEYIVLAGFLAVFLWGWRRVYLHVMRKSGRPVVAHMMGLLLSLFPARFFMMAAVALMPPPDAPVPQHQVLFLCSLFVLSVIALFFLTRKRAFPQKNLPPVSSGNPDDPQDAGPA